MDRKWRDVFADGWWMAMFAIWLANAAMWIQMAKNVELNSRLTALESAVDGEE